uniref:MATH domain-containing protein n=1 Tax=Craspedostauros australis TaxID=1486917 RepID=A0A7R9ZQK1_9STRA
MKDIHVGVDGYYAEEQFVNVHFHGFSQLSEKVGGYVASSAFDCHGFEWKVRLYPRGDKRTKKSPSAENPQTENLEDVGMFLHFLSGDSEEALYCSAMFSMAIPKMGITHKSSTPHIFKKGSKHLGYCDFASREEVLSKGCVDDTLTVKVGIQAFVPKEKVWKPTNVMQNTMLKNLQNEVMADIAFLVGPEDKQERICANSTILLMHMPAMKDLIYLAKQKRAVERKFAESANSMPNKEAQEDEGTAVDEKGKIESTDDAINYLEGVVATSDGPDEVPVERSPDPPNADISNDSDDEIIDDDVDDDDERSNRQCVIELPRISPKYFNWMLRFVYAGDSSFIETAEKFELTHALIVANQFDCWGLKLMIEAQLMEHHLDLHSCVDLLLFADGYSCTMLKEECIKLVAKNIGPLMAKGKCSKLVGCSNLMTEIHSCCAGTPCDGIEDEYTDMSVGELYGLLEIHGTVLESDMSRLMLLELVRSTLDED